MLIIRHSWATRSTAFSRTSSSLGCFSSVVNIIFKSALVFSLATLTTVEMTADVDYVLVFTNQRMVPLLV
jgi:hypothetical protein